MSAAVPASVAAVGGAEVVVTPVPVSAPAPPPVCAGALVVVSSANGHLAEDGQSHWVVFCGPEGRGGAGQSGIVWEVDGGGT